MLSFFKKRSKSEDLFTAGTGELLPIDQVADEVFSKKMLGEGYGLKTDDGRVYSPVTGVVESVFPTKHAISLKTNHGLEILVHMGIDTVEMNGEPFEIKVHPGEKVTPSTQLAQIDLNQLVKAEKDDTVMVVVTNMEKVRTFPTITTQSVNGQAELGAIEI